MKIDNVDRLMDDLLRQAIHGEPPGSGDEAEVTREDVAAEYGIPAGLAERLHGQAEAEWRQDAQALAAALQLPQPSDPELHVSLDGGARRLPMPTQSADELADGLIRRMAGRPDLDNRFQ